MPQLWAIINVGQRGGGFWTKFGKRLSKKVRGHKIAFLGIRECGGGDKSKVLRTKKGKEEGKSSPYVTPKGGPWKRRKEQKVSRQKNMALGKVLRL